MDINLVKTFLEVAATGSFVNASERLFVTQSAVSLRIQRLEDSLGRPLFTRSKAGAEMTPAGREFERYALSLIKIWEEARQQVAIPPGFHHSLSVGAQYSLWPRLGFRWIDAMRAAMSDLSIRAELGMPDRLVRMLVEGVTQIALFYTPQLRPGLSARKVMEEELILVSSDPTATMENLGRYLFVDWGPEFVQAHSLHLPDLTNPGLTMALGAMSADYLVGRNCAAYLPARFIKREVEAGQMHPVAGSPRFPYPIWCVWREDLDPRVRTMALATLAESAASADHDQEEVLHRLAKNTEDIEILGADHE